MLTTSARRKQNLERKHAVLSAILATLIQTPSDTKAKPEEYLETFKANYSGDMSSLPMRGFGKALKAISESKKREEYQRKLEKKNTKLEKKLSAGSASCPVGKGVESSNSSATLVDSEDEEEEQKEGEPLELTWTWSALGEALWLCCSYNPQLQQSFQIA